VGKKEATHVKKEALEKSLEKEHEKAHEKESRHKKKEATTDK
jgi:hypothetical protein